jgi:hypothetical protein
LIVAIFMLLLLHPEDRNPGTHGTEVWVGPKVGLDTLDKRKNLLPLQEIEPRFLGRPASSIVATPTGKTYWKSWMLKTQQKIGV